MVSLPRIRFGQASVKELRMGFADCASINVMLSGVIGIVNSAP
jgi:hypothetical protein